MIDLDDIESRINDGIYGIAQQSDADRDDAFSALSVLISEVKRLRLDSDDIEHSYNFARDKAKLLERQAVVAWLRSDEPHRLWAGSVGGSEYTCAADTIERGEHRREEER